MLAANIGAGFDGGRFRSCLPGWAERVVVGWLGRSRVDRVRLLRCAAAVESGEGTRLLHDGRLPRVQVRSLRSRRDDCTRRSRGAGPACRSVDRRRDDSERPHRHAEVGRRADRRRDHDRLLHGRRLARIGVGQHVSTDRDARRASRRAAVCGGIGGRLRDVDRQQRAGVVHRHHVFHRPQFRLDAALPARACVHHLARPDSESVWRRRAPARFGPALR